MIRPGEHQDIPGFSSARTTKRFPSSRCASAIQIVCLSRSKAALPTCRVFRQTSLYGGRN